MTDAADTLASEFFAAIERGDLDATHELYSPGVEVWHNVTNRSQTREENLALLRYFTAVSPGLPSAAPPAKNPLMAAGPDATLRQTASSWTLIRTAIGGPSEIAGKVARIARTLGIWLSPGEVQRRLDTLAMAGLVERDYPGRLQLLFGGLDMLRFLIEPASRDYYRSKGISFGFHQLLRILDDPVSMIDPTGFLSDRDTIVGHVMQVVHLNPVYDLELIQMFPDGLEDFERQVAAMVDGTHPRHRTIGAIVEDPGYHARLLDYVRRYRTDPSTAHLVREEQTLRADEHFAAAERTFARLPGFLAYCRKLPDDLPTLMRRLVALKRFPIELAAPSVAPSPAASPPPATPPGA